MKRKCRFLSLSIWEKRNYISVSQIKLASLKFNHESSKMIHGGHNLLKNILVGWILKIPIHFLKIFCRVREYFYIHHKNSNAFI